jgi:hypothetical protein
VSATATTRQILFSDSIAHLQVTVCCRYQAYSIYYLVFAQMS